MRNSLARAVPIFLLLTFPATSVSASDDHLEKLLDAVVAANFADDFPAAGQALRQVIEFERAAGVEPSGRLAVIQLRETQAFADKLQTRVRGFIQAGFPVLAWTALMEFEDVLRFEPSGAARFRALAVEVDSAGAVLCAQLRDEAVQKPGIRHIADGVCAGFGLGTAADVTAGTPAGPGGGSVALLLHPIGTLDVSGDVRGFVDPTALKAGVETSLREGPLVQAGGAGAMSVVLSGNSVVTTTQTDVKHPFEYAMQIPYAEMEEYCIWVEEVKVETVVEGGIRKTVKRTTRTCNKSQRPVDKVRLEPRTVMLDAVEWRQTLMWQYRVGFDDGQGCTASRAFEDRIVTTDVEHQHSDPAIGLAPDPISLPTPTGSADRLAGDIVDWITTTYRDCRMGSWCGDDRQKDDLETVLRCADLGGRDYVDARALDAAIGRRFGVSAAELARFIGHGG
ncbi:MAG TPA: hypothetical protein PKK50_07875 [Myxococcota bacterium]|nr:hypothetical protein [Myxococcota bacterium]